MSDMADAWEVYSQAEQERINRRMKNARCRSCDHFHPIPQHYGDYEYGYCDEQSDWLWGGEKAVDIDCEEWKCA